jgi:hypothetical protein
MKNVPDEMYAAAEEVFAVFLGMGPPSPALAGCLVRR